LRERWQFFLYSEKRRDLLSNFVYLSQEKLIEIEKELKELKTDGRKKMAQRIAEARSYGDLSENAEYDAAKEAQGHLELKISKMEELLAKAKIVDTSKLPDGEIHIHSTAEVKNLKNGKIYKYKLVSEEEANLQEGKIAISSPVGGAIMGARKGDIVDAKVPAGIIQFEILDIE